MSSPDKPTLKIDWCTYAAAKYAVENWHYSKRMPMPPIVRVGVWEGGRYIGCVLFARGASPTLGQAYGLKQTECAELVRVALTSHAHPVTRIVAIAIKFLRANSPGLRLIVSFADPAEGHHGGIYQGGGWTYTGQTSEGIKHFHDGRWKHNREITSGAFGGARPAAYKANLPKMITPGKHRYLMPLDGEMRARVLLLARPYPKRPGTGTRDGTPVEVGGSTPTPGLQP